LAKAAEAAQARCLPDRRGVEGLEGELLADIASWKDAGLRRDHDDGHPVATAPVLRRALE
jgi:hypothetical protein